jgi:hypothetical protein
MVMRWFELFGLVGVVYAVTAGSLLDWYHEWAQSFVKPHNFFRVLSDGLGCPMCVGFWAGFAWGVTHALPWADVFVCGGLVSAMSVVASEVVDAQRDLRDRLTLPVKTAKAAAARQMARERAELAARQAAEHKRPARDREGNLVGEDAAHKFVAEQAAMDDLDTTD